MVPRSIACLIACCATVPAFAQGVDQDTSPPAGLFARDTLTDGWFGLGPQLKAQGIALGATEISEVLGNVSGGAKTGAVYEGRLELDLDLDLGQLIGLDNTVMHSSAYQIHGRGLSRNDLGGNLLTVSSIEARRTIRLFDLWVEHGFFDSSLSVRAGQIAIDDEFITSQYTGALLGGTFGWPALMAQALPAGGPAYPLATPGIRVRRAFGDTLVLQAALTNGNPAGHAASGIDPEVADDSGTSFNLNVSPFAIAEFAYAPHAGEDAAAQGTTYKFGAWYQGGGFDDLAVDRAGRSLADPHSTGVPRRHDGDFGFYGIADMLLYRETGSADRGLGAFLRVGVAPDDRNFVAAYGDGGLTYIGPLTGRDNDVASLGISFARISGRAARLVKDLQRLDGSTAHGPDYEAAIEFDYQVTLAPWWTVQPDLQMIFHPTPPVLRPNAATPVPKVGNALVLAVRTSIRF